MDRRSEVIWDFGAEPTLKLKYRSLTLITRSKLYRESAQFRQLIKKDNPGIGDRKMPALLALSKHGNAD
jgi:hypothetical protein